MASGTSDILPTLSTTIPLGVGESLTTDKLIAGQYSSLSLIVFSDTALNVFVEFSGDGVNFDVSVLKSFYANQGSTENTVILSKWMRVRILNLGAAQTVLRVHTYAHIESASILASINPTNNTGPSINVGNLPVTDNSMLVEAPVTVFSSDMYTFEEASLDVVNFNQGDKVNCGGSEWLVGEHLGSGGVNAIEMIHSADGRMDIGAAPGAVGFPLVFCALLSNRLTLGCASGKTFLTFNAEWPALNFGGGLRELAIAGMASGYGNVDRSTTGLVTVDPFAAFGIYKETFVDKVDELDIAYSSGISPDGVVTIPQSSWNIDKADGTHALPIITASNGAHGFRIILEHSGGGVLTFHIQHPVTGVWHMVHRISNTGAPIFITKAMSALVYTDRRVNSFGGHTFLMGSMDLKQSASGIANTPARIDVYRQLFTCTIATIDAVSFTNKHRTETFQGTHNRLNVAFMRVRVASKRIGGAAAVNGVSRILVYAIPSSALDVLRTQAQISVTTPMQWSLSPVYTPPIPGPDPRRLISSCLLPDENKKAFSMSEARGSYDSSHGTSPSVTDYILCPGDSIMISIECLSELQIDLTVEFLTGV